MKISRHAFGAVLLSLGLALYSPSIPALHTQPVHAEAAEKNDSIALNKKKLTLTVGKSAALKLTGTSRKVKWTSSKKSVATVNSKGKVTAKKKGTATITAKSGGKTYTCKVTVKNPPPAAGSRQNPICARFKYTARLYAQNEPLGKFTIQLLDYKDGKAAKDYILKNNTFQLNPVPQTGQRYIYVKFKITYLSGGSRVNASDVINCASTFYNAEVKKKLRPIDWAFNYEDSADIANVSMKPGESVVCSKAMLVRSDLFPATYCLQTGYDQGKQQPVYTWFTTKK